MQKSPAMILSEIHNKEVTMKNVLKKTMFSLIALLSTAIYSGAVLAASSGRPGAEQVTYLTSIANGLGLLGVATLFFVGVVVFGFGGFFFVRDYVMAKDDREKKFSIGPLIMAIVVGSMLCYPGGAMLLGSDLTSGDKAGSDISNSDFKRDNP